MTYANHLKAAVENEIWKATGRGLKSPKPARFKRICKLMRYLERVR